MPTHVTTQVHIRRLKSMADFGKSVEEGQKIAEQVEIKSLGAYGLLGRHDVMFIYEALKEKAAASMPLSFAPRGDAQTETWTTIALEGVCRAYSKTEGLNSEDISC